MKQHQSIWLASSPNPSFPPLGGDLETDVAIVGAGITGLTAALLLLRSGKKVAVVEKGDLAAGESGRTTAHLTEVTDARYATLERDFGKEGARLAVEAGREAIALIERVTAELKADAAFVRVPAFYYSEREADLDMLREEAEASKRAGTPSSFTTEVPLPFDVAGAVRYDNQAQFHPRRYFVALATEITRLGGKIFCSTLATEVHDGEPCTVVTPGGTISARDVIVAANVPVNNKLFIHTKIAAYRSYAIATAVADDFLTPGLYWDTDDPYHYTRTQMIDGKNYLIVGGEDHKVGTEEDTEKCYEAVESYTRDRFGVKSFDHRWSGQIIEPVDGLPFIGRNSFSKHVYVSTGYSGQGMTFGTVGAIVNADLIVRGENKYAALLDATRIKPVAAAADYVMENVDFPKYFLEQHALDRDVETKELGDVAAGEGMIVESEGKKIAAYRDDGGSLHLLSPICPHMQCDVAWNTAEKTWDCPCHGSRFKATGEVLNGPASKDLSKIIP
jgi:glycine/D-amino acid oxidase-like deaminating enzyme/nitrite reductase/ring-hydroxylating ferredoxin subunit